MHEKLSWLRLDKPQTRIRYHHTTDTALSNTCTEAPMQGITGLTSAFCTPSKKKVGHVLKIGQAENVYLAA